MSTPRSDPPPPDLELGIFLTHEPSGLGLRFELRIHTARERPEYRSFGTVGLQKDPDKFLGDALRRIPHRGEVDGAAGAEEARHQLEDLGSYLYQQLLPRELGLFLSASIGRSLQIHSDEPWIPWELLRLEGEEDDPTAPGPFLCEAYDLSRWFSGRPQPTVLPLERIALVAVDDFPDLDLTAEIEAIEELGGVGREVTRVAARPEQVREAFASGSFDGFHIVTHGRPSSVADHSEILLSESSPFTPINLSGAARNLGRCSPFVFLNACHTGASGWSLTGIGGWAAHFLGAGSGAFLGTHWPVRNESATRFARAFYRELLGGNPIARAVRQARREIKADGDSTWLAYVLHAYPGARAISDSEPPYVASTWPGRRADEPLSVPASEWDPDIKPPGALLRAEVQAVPFHGRDRELEGLHHWCLGAKQIRVRVSTGGAGMGKTRLALELCKILRNEGWCAGFLEDGSSEGDSLDAGKTWRLLERAGRPLLIVVDYAETHRELLVGLLREALRSRGTKVRFVLLARAAGHWWEVLKSEGDGVGDLLSSRTTVVTPLRPLALSTVDRGRSFEIAAGAFSEILGRPVAESAPADLESDHYGRVLILHMAALMSVQGETGEGEDGILELVLGRERRFWENRIDTHGLPKTFLGGLERVMAAITQVQGVGSRAEALKVFEGLRFFEGRPRDLLLEAARLLHECYPGGEALWIEPLRPDLLGEHLVRRVCRDPEALADLQRLIFGSKGPPP
jgi:hypothetical protein